MMSQEQRVPVLAAKGLTKHYGHVVALENADLEVYAGQVLAVIGDNGAGKSTLIKVLSGAIQPDKGEIFLNGQPIRFNSPSDARRQGIETVYQNLAVAPAMTIVENLFLGREIRRPGILGSVFRMLDKKQMLQQAQEHMSELKFRIPSVTQNVETLSGGQAQGVAVARSAAFASKVVIMDEPMAALGVKESGMVIDLIRKIRDRGLPIILISHNMPHVFELADCIHIQRLGRRVAVIKPKDYTMSDAVAIMTGAKEVNEYAQ
ncbi:MAG: sugar ABC transporter ATP-binding protein [Anaerolineae bacterium]|nr:sugar ABC transporter ATP-binding protein [Anaerolineae bacterium]